jgi:hypothetical protein
VHRQFNLPFAKILSDLVRRFHSRHVVFQIISLQIRP